MNELIFSNLNHTRFLIGTCVGVCVGAILAGALVWLVCRANQQKARLRAELASQTLQQEFERECHRLTHDYEADLGNMRTQCARLEVQITEHVKQNAGYQRQVSQLQRVETNYIQLMTRYEEQKKMLASQHKLLETTKRQLFSEFELSATKIFDDKHKTFQQASQTNIEMVLTPFKLQLEAFHQKVEDVYRQESSQRNQLVGQIVELQKQTQSIRHDANNLASALKGDTKKQGDWGEVILERILEQSGLVKGREYDVQNSNRNDHGRLLRPDVIVHLPDHKDIIIDSKVSLKDYEAYCHAPSPSLKKQYLNRHIDSIKKHIAVLSEKKYEQINYIKTLDFVFIFIPVESAFVEASKASPQLFEYAYEKNIVLVSPSSLMVSLRTVEMIWRHERQNANAEKIASSAGKLYDQFVLVTQALEGVGGYIDQAAQSYATVFKRMTSGRGNLLSRVDQLKSLGAKTSKSLSPKLVAELDLMDES